LFSIKINSYCKDTIERKSKMSSTAKNRGKTSKNKTIRKRNGRIYFSDYPDFSPNLTPRDIFRLGSFGGTYWRPVYSHVTNKHYKNVHRKYKPWWTNIPEEHLSSSSYNKNINRYKCKVGTTLDFWEGKKWITHYNPYGWVHWYCDFYKGRRCPDDERQIKRWQGLAGPRGRFMRFLVTQIVKNNGSYDDESISPKIRQVLQHWGYKLTKRDYNLERKRRSQK
jgi:hypothetical protein